MTEIKFLSPGVVWLLLPVALGLLMWRLRPRKRHIAFSAVGWLKRSAPRPSPVRRLPAWLILLGGGCVLAALAEPVVPYRQAEVRSHGLDIVLVLDLSSSMREPMGLSQQGAALAPPRLDGAAGRPKGRTRLDVTKEALKDLISLRRDDRIGLVVFSEHAYLISPLTFDYSSLRQYVDIVDDQTLRGEGMTAIGEGIALANFLLSRQSTDEHRNKVIVVFTDGEYNMGRDPLEALADSDKAQVRVHLVGLDLKEVEARPAVQGLITAVRKYGGRYFSATSSVQLHAANAAISSLEKGSLANAVLLSNVPVFDWLAIPALMLVAGGLMLRAFPYFADFT